MRSRLFGFYTNFIGLNQLKKSTLRFFKIIYLTISLIALSLVATNVQAAQTIVVFGDSLSAAYGIQQSEGWVTLLQNKLKQEKLDYKVVNASISGETTSGGLGRFKAMLAAHKPDIVVIELGANDGLRGLSVKEMHNNLDSMINQAKAIKAEVLLLGMKIPPNYGMQYTQQFSDTYADLAKKYSLNLVPFFLDGVAGNPDLVLNDGLHPKAEAQAKLLDNVWPQLKKILP